ncbi:Rieske (2Fe-2S) protein [Gloeobacter violaceus]|uniref:Glr4293 protein n=1 Tax=Gloeobacter violaceus (strain ATCC 29082 / PCC 7421) TaxID=251221 RepID=Q7NDE2_GLOVI|nr:Rieske (2Fe-2S) protein [Gloeobacter violaceus]BAC92234.1 glr4293 [Gloeobacter violaceus PCC 7421]
MQYLAVAYTRDIPAGRVYPVLVGGRELILVRDGQDNVYALDGLCPHRHLPLAGAEVWKGVLECPWHHFQYDVRTGENLYPRRVYPAQLAARLGDHVRPLRIYPVRTVDEQIQVGMPEAGGTPRFP